MANNLAYQNDCEQKRRRELIDGALVMMSPRPAWNHNQVSSNLYYLFASYLRGKHCVPIADGTDLFLEENNRFVPDFMVVCDPEKIKPDGIHGAPDLVVEVLSPSTAQNDRGRKMETYARCGVREYWLVEPSGKTIEVYFPQQGQFRLQQVYALYPDWQLKQMTEQELADLATQFKCSLFDDLEIPIQEVFYRTF